MKELTKGDKVKLLDGPMGLLEDLAAFRFADQVAQKGDVGVYEGEHSTLGDWHLIEFEIDDQTLYCPVHHSQFEVIDQ